MGTLTDWTAHEALERMGRGEVTSRELTQAALERIASVDSEVKAFLTVTPEEALAQADTIDARRKRGEPVGLLAGIPLALKDNLCTTGVKTTAGSQILHNFVPPYDATVVRKLREAGAVLIGKTNLDEFAMGSSTENSGFFTSRNPWDLTRVPGGSSGGSAAAVAAREVPLALGSDTGGSIRQPASLCGVIGLKPTYGRVSRYGLIAYASSLDQIGPFSRDVTDCALLLNAISGHDPLDSTSVDLPVPDFTAACIPDVKGLRLGVPKEYFGAGVTAEVAEAVWGAIDYLMELGATVEECSLPTTEYGLAAYYILAPAECSSNLARFDGVKYGLRTKELAGHIGLTEKTRDEGFGAEVKQRIMIGTYALSAGYYDAYYKRAQQVRTLIRLDFERAFETFDALLTPTSPVPAFKIGEKSDPLEMKLADVCTLPVNMAGLPGISIPCGFANGLPVGLQLIGKAFDEATLFRIASAYEQATDWHQRCPALSV
ncbi:MAG TPA: Asp-tRNA(Asn)/Glu-tRNA(Gln) amidotransferase subunit GatA [Chthonomonadaceae bacterium]|nr:Asp-tRNA(Asn)/Glu-tRNA(Gln) amidotransferase subunit GatA [Chthonomonadaceae bacterium]